MEAQERLAEPKVAQLYCEGNSVGAGCPERLWNLHVWRQSEGIWGGPGNPTVADPV